MLEQEWCKIELENGRKPYDLAVCREKCQTCSVKDECVRWIDMNKSDQLLTPVNTGNTGYTVIK